MEVVPQLVEDVSLKRSRVQLEGGGEAIKVIGVGSNVSITPTLVSGTKIADYSIDETPGVLYAPNGGVGQAYPESTGGEIFNYYGTDSNENKASGDYSTAIGLKNNSAGDYSFTAGHSNECHGASNIALGESNTITNIDNACAIGKGNVINGGNRSVVIGRDNTCYDKDVCVVGRGLSTKSENCTYVGSWNDAQNDNNNNHFVVGVGSSSNPKTAIQCTGSYTKLSTPLRLEYDSTEVNAITAPSDPNYPSQEDKTLMTLGYFSSTFMKMMMDQDIEDMQPGSKPEIFDNDFYRLSVTTYRAIICFFSDPPGGIYFSLTMNRDLGAISILNYTFYDGFNQRLYKISLSLDGDKIYNNSGVAVTLLRVIYIF